MDVDTELLEQLNLLTRDGAQAASDALGQMVGRETTVDVTRITVASEDDVAADLRTGDATAVEFGIDGTLSGTLLFSFEPEAAETVTDLLLPDGADESMARSSVTELANVMMGGFLSGWGDHLGTGLDASPPTYLDGDALDTFEFDSVSPETDSVLAFQTTIEWRDDEIGIGILLVPDRASLQAVLDGDETDDGADVDLATLVESADASPAAFGLDDAEPAETDDTESADDAFGGGDSDLFDEGDDAESISAEKLSAFSDLTRQGTNAAAQRLTSMTGIETVTELAGINFTPVEDIFQSFGYEDAVGAVCTFEGPPSGHVVIVFDRTSAVDVAGAMVPTDDGGDELSGMGESALEELGNIMVSGFVDGWANALQTSVEHTPPEFTQDVETSLMEIVTGQLGAFQTHAFSIESEIRNDDLGFACGIHAFPDEADLGDALDSLLLDQTDQTTADPDDLF